MRQAQIKILKIRMKAGLGVKNRSIARKALGGPLK